jgi:hypothetical protein
MEMETRERGGRKGERREDVEEIGGRKTYRTLDEQEGQLSEAEERFERHAAP